MRVTQLYISALFALTIFAMPSAAHASEILAESKVTAVTVFTDRAAVTRTATFELPQGASTLLFSNLPLGLFTDSLRTEGSAAAAVTLGAIENRLRSSAELAAPRERELNSQLQDLTDKRALLEAEQTALTRKNDFLSQIAAQAAARTNEQISDLNLKPEQWQAAANSLMSGTLETLQGLARKAVELRTLTEQITALQNELVGLQTGARQMLEVRIPVEARATTRLTLNLTYQIANASWAPVYDARLETATGKLTLTQYGEVVQQTGEDWADVKLTLSTAQPARGAALPPLEPLWVDFYAPEAMQRKAMMFEGMSSARSNVSAQMEMSADMAMGAAPEVAASPVPQEAVFQAASFNTGGYVSEYAIAGVNSVLANGSARKVMIGNLQASSELMVKVKPQVDSSAYLVAVTKLGGEAPLLPGMASLFRDGAFIGSLALPLLRPGEETDLGFGVDDQVVVKHRILKDETGQSGVISKDNTRTRITLTEVQNLHKIPIRMALLQNSPAARNSEIKLSVLPETTQGFTKDVDNIPGQYRWSSDLAAGQKTEIRFGWTLSWPLDKNISGLPY